MKRILSILLFCEFAIASYTNEVSTRGCYDFIVPDDGTIVEALKKAAGRTNTSVRYRIFVRKGNYVIPADSSVLQEGTDGQMYPSIMTKINTPNISIIGEDMDETVISNTAPATIEDPKWGPQNPLEGIGRGDVLQLQRYATGTYIQDITIKSGMADATGRNIALNDYSDKTILKNVCLWGYQDTYVSSNNNGRFYIEGGRVRGATDYMCGSGDVFYNGVELQLCKSGVMTASGTSRKYGYVFNNCRITGPSSINGKYTLGRPWGQGTPQAIYINTEMEYAPKAEGWGEMGDGWPARFAEFNSHLEDGTSVSLDGRKTSFPGEHTNNPVLSAEEAAKYTIENVMGCEDQWNPSSLSKQTDAPANIQLEGFTLCWIAPVGAIGYVVSTDSGIVAFTTDTYYTVTDVTKKYTVRAVNNMGGLGKIGKIGGGVPVGTKVTIANWTFDGSYDIDGTTLTPNGGEWVEIKTKWFSDGAPKIYPDEYYYDGKQTNYIATASNKIKEGSSNNGEGWAMVKPDKNGTEKTFRIINNNNPSEITAEEYTDASKHRVYFQFTFPTNGLDSICMSYSLAYGGSKEMKMATVVSADKGNSWNLSGVMKTSSNWRVYTPAEYLLTEASDKDRVMVRLLVDGQGASNWNLNYFTVTGRVAEEPSGIMVLASEKTKTHNTGIFNLQGQRVTHPTSGIFIFNGKKIVLK